MNECSYLRKAEIYWIKFAQMSCYKQEIETLQQGKDLKQNSRIAQLSPYLDEIGLIRVGG